MDTIYIIRANNREDNIGLKAFVDENKAEYEANKIREELDANLSTGRTTRAYGQPLYSNAFTYIYVEEVSLDITRHMNFD